MTITVKLLSHASVVIDTGRIRILTDPWWSGCCFNESWALITSAAELDLGTIDYLWLSHEHPDHFHIPTLRAMPDSFRKRVTVLFQQSSDYPKMVDALTAIGFKTIELLPHRRWVRLAGADVLCFQSRQMDSALAVRSGGSTVLNLNDCDFGPTDWAEIRRLVGEPDILLNQFSLAGFDGIEQELPKIASRILDDMVAAHRALGAKVTVPFASFAYFCCQDNAFLNPYANRPRAVARRFAEEKLNLAVLTPGDTYEGGAMDNSAALDSWENSYAAALDRPLADPVAVPMEEILKAFEMRCERLRDYHGVWAKFLPPIIVDAAELGRLRFDFGRGTVTRTAESADYKVAPDPLLFFLKWDFGSQTLGVSGRYRRMNHGRKWTFHKILFAMINAGIGLSARKLFSRRQLAFFWRRRGDIVPQTYYSLRRG